MNQQLSELRKQPHWSFSSLNGFINVCSLQWAFRYIYKLEPVGSTPINLVFGTSFHKTASLIAILRQKNIYSLPDEAMNLFTEMWNIEYKADDNLMLSNDDWDKLNDTGRKMIGCLNSKWLEDNIVSIGKAFSVFFPGTSKALVGEIDLIVKDDNDKTILVDWKTSARRWPVDKSNKDLQATCFLYAYEQIEPDYSASESQFRYDVITKTKEPSYTQHPTYRNKDDFHRLAQLIRTVERAVKAEVFLPNETSFYCSSCQYKSACKSWHTKQATTIFPALAA
jgi:hypothetical protein